MIIQNVPKEREDEISALCFRSQALGVSEKLDFHQKNYPKPKIIEKKFKILDAYFEKEPQELLMVLQQNYPELEILVQEQESQDWLAEWKKGFHAFSLYKEFWIVPSWENAPQDCIPLFIDPGMAFGTGTHETTQLCAELIYEAIRQNQIQSMVDVGTGTGILSFLASKMGVPHVLGTDNDLEAIRVARENAILNNVNMEFSHQDLSQISQRFDLVVANIIDGILIRLKENLIRKMNPQGKLILSGIILENDQEFKEEFLKGTQLKIEKRLQKGEWVGYLLS